ncbi:hypothetical protein EGJ22_18765 [Pseudomonas sp. p99-361]|nr:hypothetical protein F1602_07550 [Pseudomonas putida]RRV13538.1 hypothetical protein EGJ22_18765 [Pseudomonas sp. p99-361]
MLRSSASAGPAPRGHARSHRFSGTAPSPVGAGVPAKGPAQQTRFQGNKTLPTDNITEPFCLWLP